MISVITPEVLELHRKYIEREDGGVRLVTVAGPLKIEANLCGADLRGAYLHGADLRGAYLHGADLRGANLREAYLRGAYLREAYLDGANLDGADLCGADLREADLREADLRRADLGRADLGGANLGGANLDGANLDGANLDGARNVDEYVNSITSILPAGELVGWKKLRDGVIAKLRIPASAKRSNATSRKCRAECAVVMELWKGNELVECGRSIYDIEFVYRVGETVQPQHPFDCDRWNECGSGIHFFITRYEAEQYH